MPQIFTAYQRARFSQNKVDGTHSECLTLELLTIRTKYSRTGALDSTCHRSGIHTLAVNRPGHCFSLKVCVHVRMCVYLLFLFWEFFFFQGKCLNLNIIPHVHNPKCFWSLLKMFQFRNAIRIMLSQFSSDS